MVRLIFFVSALVVLALGLTHLPLMAEPVRTQAVEGASARASLGVTEVAQALEARRLGVQRLALKLASSPEVAGAVQPRVVPLPKGKGIRVEEPPLEERFAGLRGAVEGLVPEELKLQLVLGLSTQNGALHLRYGDAQPSADAAVLDVQELAKAGAEGRVVDAFSTPHLFFSVPVLWSAEGGTPDVAATVVVGVPLVQPKDTLLEKAASAAQVSALALVKEGAVVQQAGAQPTLVAEALQVLQAGQSKVVQFKHQRVLADAVKQVQLPLFLRPDNTLEMLAPAAVGTRRALEGLPFEVVSVVDVQPAMARLAESQEKSLFVLGGLLLGSLLLTVVVGFFGPRAAAEAPAKKGKKAAQEPAVEPILAPQALTVAPTILDEAPAPGPDDFQFPASSSSASASQAEAFPYSSPPVPSEPYAPPVPSGDAFPFASPADSYTPPAPSGDAFPFASPADSYPPPAAPGAPDPGTTAPYQIPPSMAGMPPQASSRQHGAFAFEDSPTAAYSLQQAADPFAAAQAQYGGAPAYHDEPAEATRVTAIPQELLLAAARPMSAENPMPMAAPRAAPPPPQVRGGTPHMGNSAVALSEEQHFQDVFREFVSTREQCGEPNDGLTYEKFVGKLRKNKEQLVQKYACKTVRFQVYVKEGKAALKATPVKD
jgi:hypothetical protein